MQLQLVGGGGGVDRLAQRQKRDVALLELGDRVDEVAQAAAEAVQSLHHERVAGPEKFEQGL